MLVQFPVCNLLRLLLLLLSLRGSIVVTTLEIEEMTDDLKVAISLGAEITPIDDVILYTATEHLYFVLPDVPNPPTVSPPACPESEEFGNACNLFSNMQKGVKDISELLVVHNRILTTHGLKAAKFGENSRDLLLPPSSLLPIENVDVNSNRPTEEMIREAGTPWFNETQAQLMLRSFIAAPNLPIKPRFKRWLQAGIKPLVKAAAGAVTSGGISDIFDKLFVGDNSILSHLTGSRLLSKKEFQIFTTLPKHVSELQVETKRLLMEVLKSTDLSKKLSQHLQEAAQQHDLQFATVEEAFLLEQNTLADLIRQVYTSAVYGVHFNAFEECRNSLTPTAFIPPELLRERLVQIQERLPENIKLAIPPQAIQRYYKLPLTECVFDSNGGLARVAVPLVEVDANFKLFAFKALHFSHGDKTCTLETGASHIVKDLKHRRAYSVTDLDKDTCNVANHGLCRIPMASSDDSTNFCVSVLLSEQPAHKIKEACKLQCFEDKRPSVSQISSNVFIGNHLPPTGIRMECADKVFQLNSAVPNGAVKFEGSCGCKILMGSKLMGTVSSKACSNDYIPQITAILPLQMTKIQDMLPFSTDGKETAMYDHATEVYNPKFQSGEDIVQPTTNYGLIASYSSWNFLHLVLIMYLLMRVNEVSRALGAIREKIKDRALMAGAMGMTMVPGAYAHADHECNLPADAYALLIAILSVCLLGVIPSLVIKLLGKGSNMVHSLIETAAHRIAIEQDEEEDSV